MSISDRKLPTHPSKPATIAASTPLNGSARLDAIVGVTTMIREPEAVIVRRKAFAVATGASSFVLRLADQRSEERVSRGPVG